MPFAREAFSLLGETATQDGRTITAADLRDINLLAIRSTTRVDAALLEGSPVQFVGTATIGTDHMDIAYLEKQGITWCYAPGCNANSVSEYVTSALLCLACRDGFPLAGRTLGIIGVGNVGSRVAEKARALGLRVLLNDPPRQRAWKAPSPHPFVTLDTLMAESDIITLHVPLTRDGPDATWHMADARFFSRIRRGTLLINAARGAVLDSDAWLHAVRAGILSHTVLDTWEGEPEIRPDVLACADLGTPHIAGHSFEGKAEGTAMVYRAACAFLGIPANWDYETLLPPPPVPCVPVHAAGLTDEQALWAAVQPVYDLQTDDTALRAGTGKKHFDTLRKNYPVRREFRYTRIPLTGASPALTAKFRGLGFQVEPA